MGTKATINYVKLEGKIERIWVTHDGYLDHVGNLLLNHYNTPEKIEALLEKGEASSLGETLEASEFYSERDGEDSPSEILEGLEDYPESCFEEYRYLFKEGKWFVEFGFWGERELKKSFSPTLAEKEREILKYNLYLNYKRISEPYWRNSIKEKLTFYLFEIQEDKKVEFSLSFEELETIKKKIGKKWDSLFLEAGIENLILEFEKLEGLFTKEEEE